MRTVIHRIAIAGLMWSMQLQAAPWDNPWSMGQGLPFASNPWGMSNPSMNPMNMGMNPMSMGNPYPMNMGMNPMSMGNPYPMNMGMNPMNMGMNPMSMGNPYPMNMGMNPTPFGGNSWGEVNNLPNSGMYMGNWDRTQPFSNNLPPAPWLMTPNPLYAQPPVSNTIQSTAPINPNNVAPNFAPASTSALPLIPVPSAPRPPTEPNQPEFPNHKIFAPF